MTVPLRTAIILAFCSVLSACSLPRGAALQQEITRSAQDPIEGLAIYAVTRPLLAQVAKWPVPQAARGLSWPPHRHEHADAPIAPGDMIDLAVWDSNESSLFTAPGQKAVDLRGIRVSGNGTIFLPYLDTVHVAGKSQDAARRQIQREMEALIPSAQVQLSVTQGLASSVDLLGSVGKPGSYPVADRHFTVLGLLSAGGGVSDSVRNPRVKLVRSGRSYATRLSDLYDRPALNTVLRGGDRVIVAPDDRYFLSLGAAGQQDLQYFTKENVSALDAMAIIGGISASRANPKGILVLREYARIVPGERGPREKRVVFTIDLTSADGLFSAGKFDIMPGDLVLVTESPVTTAETVFGLIGSVFGLSRTVSSL